LQRANDLVRNKIHPTSIISGYRVSQMPCFELCVKTFCLLSFF
jgi:chaperonin GroEL (HSP60 family)